MPPLEIFLSSLLIGLSIAAPVGPIGLLTIQRSLEHGARAGLATGLGAAAADAVYGAIGAYGVSWLVNALVAARVPLALFGGGFLLWMAWQLWRAPVAQRAASTAPARNGWQYFASTFVLTLSNPATIFSFIAIFGSMAGRAGNLGYKQGLKTLGIGGLGLQVAEELPDMARQFYETFREFPPRQRPDSFNLEGVLRQMESAGSGGQH